MKPRRCRSCGAVVSDETGWVLDPDGLLRCLACLEAGRRPAGWPALRVEVPLLSN